MRLVTSTISNTSDTSDAGVRVPQHIMANGASDSYVFKVHNEAAVLTAYNLTEGEVVLHAVLLTETEGLTVPLLSNGTPIKLTPTNNRIVIPEEGTYQLATTTANVEAIIALTYTKDYSVPVSVTSGMIPVPTPTTPLRTLSFRKLQADLNTVPTYLAFGAVQSEMDASLGMFNTDAGSENRWFNPQRSAPSLYKFTLHIEGNVSKLMNVAGLGTYPFVALIVSNLGVSVAYTIAHAQLPQVVLAQGETVSVTGYFVAHLECVVELTAGTDAIQVLSSSNAGALGYDIQIEAHNSYLAVEALNV